MSTNTQRKPNRLANESSPYLLQHAHNPVDWFPWSEEAFAKAKEEDKPVLVSIGYSACHWCHVMERESFEDENVAAFMNEHFVNVKVDREERPDVDHVYMEAVQAMAGQGGWPLNVFLTPDRKPFYGGTYFPPRPAYGRASWIQVLQSLHEAYTERHEEVYNQAEVLTDHLRKTNSLPTKPDAKTDLEHAYPKLVPYFDKANGGFGHAPKFPNTASLQHLLRHHRKYNQPEALQHVTKSLDKILRGGIYDQLGGGLCRYSTDERWLVPHFEKMLYDNAQFVSTLADAYRITKQEHYKQAIHHTIAFVQRELMSNEKLFYAALDADSEGVEGKFYVWQYDELKSLLTEGEFNWLQQHFDISHQGNWEEQIILERVGESWSTNESVVKKLMVERDKRVRPSLDDKILVSWNALMQLGLLEAGLALNHQPYIDLALESIDKLLEVTKRNGNALHHNYKEGKAYNLGMLDDYALVGLALLRAAEASGNLDYLKQADALAQYVLENFFNEELHFFAFTENSQTDLPAQKVIYYDGVTPSGNSAMYGLLSKLYQLTGNIRYGDIVPAMEYGVIQSAVQYPISFGNWLSYFIENASLQIVVLNSPDWKEEMMQLEQNFYPAKVVLPLTEETDDPEIMQGKFEKGEKRYYVCTYAQCDAPLSDFKLLQEKLGIV